MKPVQGKAMKRVLPVIQKTDTYADELGRLQKENDWLRKQTAIAHHALKYLIESNRVSAATRIYYANGAYNTLGNIRAELPAGTDARDEQ